VRITRLFPSIWKWNHLVYLRCAHAQPGQPTRSIGLYTQQTYDRYQQSYDNGYNGYGYGYDTRIGIYYAPNGDCSNLQEVACGDNYYSSYGPAFPPYRGDGYVEYYNPPPGRYYIQVASVGGVNRGAIRLQVRDPQEPPPQSDCCYHGQCITGILPDNCRQAGGIPVSHCDPSLPCDSQIPPAQDCFHTTCGKTFYDFANTPIPCGFFDPGSQPFDSKVPLGGSSPDGMDTRMNRLNLMTFPTFPMTASTPIELVSLSLQSCQPITVRYCNGVPDQQWNLTVTLSSAGPPPPVGNMIVTKTYPNGGTFQSQFFVQPVFTFTPDQRRRRPRAGYRRPGLSAGHAGQHRAVALGASGQHSDPAGLRQRQFHSGRAGPRRRRTGLHEHDRVLHRGRS
jgi:hypothetical protein